MTIIDAKKIGSKQAIVSVLIGLMVAQVIMTYMMSIDRGFPSSFFWFVGNEYLLNIIIGVLILIVNAYFFGKKAGELILIYKINALLVGVLTAIVIVTSTSFLTGLIGYYQVISENLNSDDKPFFHDYVLKPVYWISVFGFIPVLIIGLWFGRRVKRKGELQTKNATQ